MNIRALTSFKHGRATFEKNIVYNVPERVGGYFVGVGWAKEDIAGADEETITIPVEELTGDAPRVAADLEVQDVNIGIGD